MRVAFVLWPAAAHLYPIVPTAWALRAAGHEVYLVSHPSIGEAVTGQGLPFAPFCDISAMPYPLGPGGVWAQERADVGRITHELAIPPQDLGLWITFSQFLLVAAWDFLPYRGTAESPMPAMDGLVSFFQDWQPDLVIWDPCMPGAAVAAQAVGARHCRFTGPDFMGWSLDTIAARGSRPDGDDVDNPLVETIRPMAEKYGVTITQETLYGEWTINPMPPAINFPVETRMLATRWIPHVTQEPMPEWLYPVERPRVAVSLGVSTRAYIAADWSHLAILLEALGGLDIDVVATLNAVQLEHVDKVPDNVRLVDYFPLDQLAATCSLIIHHGGFGSMITAGNAGVPQLVVDFLELEMGASTAADGTISSARYPLAPVTGGFVLGHGAGEILDLSRPDVETIRAQVSRVLADPAIQRGAQRLYQDLALSPSPTDIVPILERIVRAA
ncbi:glycosyltransferase [Allocatelliglobosispora scoriae]|uniref:Glycosyltransferase n=1 Tax=Allocatelliglobosispora scoriae TaxID=643052 RepID=A0A841BRJ4_9ACTN|nr:nucleotide disphospho-sugar-binding domain-containing protein [Allocatelliglobosispora scoriae]MBB5870018.1 glycosyltransferase [Allocatelliglobosispora scoriae]